MRYLRFLLVGVLAAVIPSLAAFASPDTTPGVVLAIDADPSGNGPRSVGTIKQCLSAEVGQPVDIDIVLLDPGIPAERGIAAFQFSLLYDPTVVWVNADAATEMLLAQASGSSVLPIQDPKPDKNGFYVSWAVDFGRPKGIEPDGPSEIGPGVISRITLLPQSNGSSALTLADVVFIDDASEKIAVDSVESGTITVGGPCDSQSGRDNGVDDGVDDDGDSGLQGGAANGVNDESDTGGNVAAAVTEPTPLPNPARAVPSGGSAPPPGGDVAAWFIILGLVAILGGAVLLVVSRPAFTGQTSRAVSPGQDGNSTPQIEDSEIPSQDANSLRKKRQ